MKLKFIFNSERYYVSSKLPRETILNFFLFRGWSSSVTLARIIYRGKTNLKFHRVTICSWEDQIDSHCSNLETARLSNVWYIFKTPETTRKKEKRKTASRLVLATYRSLYGVPFFLCRSLESLGALPCKMRIQANDDVYETTRHRMAVAEENNKNKW